MAGFQLELSCLGGMGWMLGADFPHCNVFGATFQLKNNKFCNAVFKKSKIKTTFN